MDSQASYADAARAAAKVIFKCAVYIHTLTPLTTHMSGSLMYPGKVRFSKKDRPRILSEPELGEGLGLGVIGEDPMSPCRIAEGEEGEMVGESADDDGNLIAIAHQLGDEKCHRRNQAKPVVHADRQPGLHDSVRAPADTPQPNHGKNRSCGENGG